MNSKWNLISSIIQLVVGIMAIIAFIILVLSGENMTRWIITLILAIIYVVLGIIGIFNYKTENSK